MRTPTRSLLVAMLFALAAAPDAADAQRRRGDPPDRAQLEQRMRAQMGRMMQERLGLDEEQAARLSEVVQSFEGQRRALARREQEARRRVDALAGADGDEPEALELLRLQAQLRVEEASLVRAELDALLQVLTPRQVLALQAMREDLGRRIRDLRGGGRDGVREAPRGPGPRGDGRIGEYPTRGRRPPVS